MIHSRIKINSQNYDSQNYRELSENECNDNSWSNSIVHFLENWFDDTDSIITQTSGSTGTPKNIHLSKQSMIHSARLTNRFFGLTITSKALLCLPATYIAGKMMLVRAMVGEYELICVDPSVNPFHNLHTEIDFAAITPYQLHHSIESLKNSTVHQIIVGGAAVQRELEEQVSELSSRLFETYGMTETTSHIALRAMNGADKSDCFSVLDGISIYQDNRGCLVISAPHLTEQEIVTNDIVEFHDHASFRWLGRADFVINSGGIKIHPEQLERKLASVIPFNFFIASLPDKILQHKVVLCIEHKQLSAEEMASLRSILLQKLSSYELPKEIICMEEFVYATTQKILRHESLKRYLDTESSLS